MKKYLVIHNELVIDTILWDGQSAWSYPFPYDHLMECDGFAGIGWSFIDGEMIAPSYGEE